MKLIKIIGAVALLAAATSANAVPFVIDHFDAADNGFATEPSGVVTTTTSDAGILGGSRTNNVSAPDNFDATSGQNITWTTGGAQDQLVVSNGAGVQGILNLVWDASGSGLNGGAGVDISVGGLNNFIRVNVLSIDLTTTVSFTLVDAATNSFTTGAALFGGPGVFLVPLADFVGVDATQVTSIQMTLTGATAWDGVFDLIETGTNLPTPAPVALLGLGLAALGLKRRKNA